MGIESDISDIYDRLCALEQRMKMDSSNKTKTIVWRLFGSHEVLQPTDIGLDDVVRRILDHLGLAPVVVEHPPCELVEKTEDAEETA